MALIQDKIAASPTSQVVLQENRVRRGYSFFNDSDSFCFISKQNTAAADNFWLKIEPHGFYEDKGTLSESTPVYCGVFSVVWEGDSPTGNLHYTEKS